MITQPTCLTPDTLILHGDVYWTELRNFSVGDEVVGFDESPVPGKGRFLRPSRIESLEHTTQQLWTVHTEMGPIHASRSHQWLVSTGKWASTEQLTKARSLSLIARPESSEETPSYQQGYLVGFWFMHDGGWDNARTPVQMYFHQNVNVLQRVRLYLQNLGYNPPSIQAIGEHYALPYSYPVEHPSQERGENSTDPEFLRGFLGGFVDAGGFVLPLSQQIRSEVAEAAEALDIPLSFRGSHLDVNRLSFASRVRAVDYVAPFKTKAVFDKVKILEIEKDGPTVPMIDIRTSTNSYYANGFATK